MQRKKAPPQQSNGVDKEPPLDLSDVPPLKFTCSPPPRKKKKIASPELFDAIIDKYVETQKTKGLPLTMTGMALALGFANKGSMFDYERYPEYTDCVKRCRALIEESLEERIIKGQYVQGAMFYLSQPWMGWINPAYQHRVTHEGSVQHTHRRTLDWSKLDDSMLEQIAAAALPPPRNLQRGQDDDNVIDLVPEKVKVGNGED